MKSLNENFPQTDRCVKDILIHYGELALKGGNRGWFENRLADNISATLHGMRISSVERLYGRIRVVFADGYPLGDIHSKLSRVFGVASFAPTFYSGAGLADIENTVISALSGRQFGTFAVRARRVDKRLPYTSQEVNEKIGSAMVRWCDGAMVDLENPELTVWIEILSEGAYVCVDKFPGPGGLPVGTSGRVACLISGGIDSPVAAWRMMKRGCVVDFIHFHSAPFTDSASQEKVSELVEGLSLWQCGLGRLIMVPLGDIQRKIVTVAPEKYRVILYRRFMVRLASLIAKEYRSEALVTGEALGQVASQTLSNMATVEDVADLPMLRPLIGMDKQEIVDLAKRIGTYGLSIIPHQDCCQFLEPRHPVTHTTAEEIGKIEAAFDVDMMVKEGLTKCELQDTLKKQ